jgi:hypothetical protein
VDSSDYTKKQTWNILVAEQQIASQERFYFMVLVGLLIN